ncbi:MAG: chloride channel protein [Acidimicrobiales bacterium]|jgi:H+/Cl- antiporter ClcA
MSDTATEPPTSDTSAIPDPTELLKSRSYIQLLVLAALIGVPVSAVAYGYQALVGHLQDWFFTSIPSSLGFHGAPVWWPAPLLLVAGVLVSLSITYLPGTSGHEPAEGFHTGAPPLPIELPGVLLASLATLAFGVVLGPEAPLIAIGGGLGVLAVRLAARDAPPMASTVIAAAGSFAAMSTLLGSPIIGAFLLMEASGIAGPTLGLVLVPGLLAAGVGTLIFVGLDNLTGLGTFSLAIPGLPAFSHPTGILFLWAVAIGAVATLAGTAIHLCALALQAVVVRRRLLMTPVAGLVVAGIAIGFAEITGKGATDVLFSGQSQLPGLVLHATTWTVGALVVLGVAKALAYAVSLSGFRGGPIFPAMFVGAAIGLAGSHLPDLSLVPAVAMGIGAMATVMLRLPLTSTLLAVLLFASDGLSVTPLVIVAVVVAYVLSARVPQNLSELGRRTGTKATDTTSAPAPPVEAAGAAG